MTLHTAHYDAIVGAASQYGTGAIVLGNREWHELSDAVALNCNTVADVAARDLLSVVSGVAAYVFVTSTATYHTYNGAAWSDTLSASPPSFPADQSVVPGSDTDRGIAPNWLKPHRKIESPLTHVLKRRCFRAKEDLGLDDGQDNRVALQNAIDAISATGGGEIVLRGRFDCSSSVFMKPNVFLSTVGESRIDYSGGNNGALFRFHTGCENAGILGDIILNHPDAGSQILIQSGTKDILLDGISGVSRDGSDNQTDQTVLMNDFIFVASSENLQVLNITADGTGSLFNTTGDPAVTKDKQRYDLRNLRYLNPSHQRNVVRFGQDTYNADVEKVYMGPYPAWVEGGHCIQTQAPSAGPKIENLTFRKIHLEGRPGVAAKSGNAVGATGDMVALRGVAGYTFSQFLLEHGGEYAFDGLDESLGGVISNGVIRYIDGSGIIVGATGGSDGPVEDTNIHGVIIHDVGLDHNNELGHNATSGIILGHSDKTTITGCHIHRSRTYAIYVTSDQARPADNLLIEANSYGNNGSQNNGGSAVWHAQEPRIDYSGGVIGPASQPNGQRPAWTGVIDGKRSINGAGDIAFDGDDEDVWDVRFFHHLEADTTNCSAFSNETLIGDGELSWNISNVAGSRIVGFDTDGYTAGATQNFRINVGATDQAISQGDGIANENHGTVPVLTKCGIRRSGVEGTGTPTIEFLLNDVVVRTITDADTAIPTGPMHVQVRCTTVGAKIRDVVLNDRTPVTWDEAAVGTSNFTTSYTQLDYHTPHDMEPFDAQHNDYGSAALTALLEAKYPAKNTRSGSTLKVYNVNNRPSGVPDPVVMMAGDIYGQRKWIPMIPASGTAGSVMQVLDAASATRAAYFPTLPDPEGYANGERIGVENLGDDPAYTEYRRTVIAAAAAWEEV